MPTPPAAGSPSPGPSPTAAENPTSAVYPGALYGDRMYLALDRIQNDDPGCYVHLLISSGIGQGISLSGCGEWDRDLHFLWVQVRNRSSGPLGISLDRFRLTDGQGDDHEATYIGDQAARPESFLPPSTLLRPGKGTDGWVTFEAPWDIVPRILSYELGKQTLMIRIKGSMRRIPPGGELDEG